MDLIDDDFLISVLKSDQYNLPLKKHKQTIKIQLGILTLKTIACSTLFTFVYLAINSSHYFQNENQKIILFSIILFVATILFIKGLKQAHILSQELFKDNFEIKKDFLVDASYLVSRKENKAINSSSVLFRENGSIEILNSSENYNYYLKRKKYFLKARKSYTSKIAIPYHDANTLFKKLAESPKEREVLLVLS